MPVDNQREREREREKEREREREKERKRFHLISAAIPPETMPVDNRDQISVGRYLAISSLNTSKSPNLRG
jgi:hypothetical protein